MNTDNQFSAHDAACLVVLARLAPLKNMQHAEQVVGILDRFAKWYEIAAINAAMDAAAEIEDSKIRSVE